MTTADQVTLILAELEKLGTAENRAGMARFGINVTAAFGVSVNAIRQIARAHRRNHELALALWDTGRHEVRILATIVDDPKRLTEDQMARWVLDLDSWDLCDQACCNLFVYYPEAPAIAHRWIDDEREFVRRAGFSLIAYLAVHRKLLADHVFAGFLGPIERRATDPRNFVRKAVNWALRQIGKRNLSLHGPALQLAEKLAMSSDKTARWIGKDAARELRDPATVDRIRLRSSKKDPA